MDDRSRSGPATDFFVHVNCLSDAEQYGNKSSYFTNNMNPPILLPYHTPYEIAISNIYFKKDFYPIIANDNESSVHVVFYRVLKHTNSNESNNDSEVILLKYNLDYSVIDQLIVDTLTPSLNLTGDMNALVKEYN